MQRAKLTASFSGEPMRNNLIKQLDHWGVPQWLGINGAAGLFGECADLVQFTSLLRFPTFVSGRGYAGSPDMVCTPLLNKLLYEYFVTEVHQLPNAIFFGLGPKVHSVLDKLVRERVIGADQVASGMLHPSSNNTYRISYLMSNRRDPVPHATNPAPYDAGRAAFRKRLAARDSF